MKSDVISLPDVFQKFVKVSTKENGINPLLCVSLPVYTYQCALKNTDVKSQTLQHKGLIFLLGNNNRGGLSSVTGDRYVVSDGNKKFLFMDANKLYGQSMCQVLLYD